MTDLALVGEAADFQSSSVNAPDWEHLVLQRQMACRVVAIDRLHVGRIGRRLRSRYGDPARLWQLGKALQDAPLILAQSEQSGYNAALALAARRDRRPLLIVFHGHRWWSRRNQALGKLAARLGNVRFLCLSSSLAPILTEEYGVPNDRVCVTGYGADDRFFMPSNSDETTCIVSAGSASRDYRLLAEASRGLAAEVCVAADSTWYRETANVASANLPPNMQMCSSGDYIQLRALYARAAFVVVPLLDVRFACGYAVIAEAMAMGKAVIATRTQAPSDLIEDGVTGLYVPPGDAPALAAAMARLLDDPEQTRRMGAAARQATVDRLSLAHYVTRLRRVMDRHD